MGDSVKKKIGLFGGTFNPIHFGHINLVLELKEKNGLDEVWLIPSLISPFRIQEPILAARHRLKMLQCVASELEGLKIVDLELKRTPPSYTVDTVKEIQAANPESSFFLLFGEDTLIRFSEWKDPLEIVRRIPLLIGSRHHSELLHLLPTMKLPVEISTAIQNGIQPTRQMEISATDIRERLKKKLYCGHFVPGKVLDYIYENQLYFTP